MAAEEPQTIKARLSMIATDAMDCIAGLQCQVSDLRTERDELKSTVAAWEYNNEQVQKLSKRLAASRIPRVITADELREGQLICIHRWHGWGVRAIGEFQGIEGDVVTIKTGGSGTFTESVKFHTIVLLADEPAKDVDIPTPTLKENGEKFTRPVTAEDIRNSEPGTTFEDRYGDDWEWNGTKVICNEVTGNPDGVEPEIALDAHGPLTRSTAVPRGTYPKRLTVSDLDAADVGSVLKSPEGYSVRKDRSGWGWDRLGAEELLAISAIDWSTATLTPPEKPELPKVPNPGKHPVIMVHSGKDSGLPVREEVAVWDGDDGYMGKGFHLYPEEVRSWSPVRIVVEGEG